MIQLYFFDGLVNEAFSLPMTKISYDKDKCEDVLTHLDLHHQLQYNSKCYFK